jgi:hypothetical protein
MSEGTKKRDKVKLFDPSGNPIDASGWMLTGLVALAMTLAQKVWNPTASRRS